MAYTSGVANNLAALLSALRSACVGQGWSLDGDVLHKGGVYVRVWVDTYASVRAYMVWGGFIYGGSVESLYIRGGTGIDGGNALVGGGPACPRIGPHRAGSLDVSPAAIPLTFPVEYEIYIHSDPDEVFLVVKHDVDFFQHLSFGHNPFAEDTGGTGAWYSATLPATTQGTDGQGTQVVQMWYGVNHSAPIHNAAATVHRPAPAAPMFNGAPGFSMVATPWTTSGLAVVTTGNARAGLTHSIHHGVDIPAGGWSGDGRVLANVSVTCAPKFERGISSIDGSAPLIRPIASLSRADSKISTIAQGEHYRLVRIDNLIPQQIVSLGPDRWRVYPFMRRGPGEDPLGAGNTSRSHTGFLGWAVRYDGP